MDAGVAKSTICHLVHGKSNPLYTTLDSIVKALEFQLARKLPHREIVSKSGKYPTKYICSLAGCSGCLPDKAYSEDGNIKIEWLAIEPGKWTGDTKELKPNDAND